MYMDEVLDMDSMDAAPGKGVSFRVIGRFPTKPGLRLWTQALDSSEDGNMPGVR
ncbi:hypothetical protein AX14_006747 [Amanita brunnescens Koide BX004]|nr:hypothetical protein AX14_006747 [Amanita brunnescens Koide BX004]